jgi:hypothetical protein
MGGGRWAGTGENSANIPGKGGGRSKGCRKYPVGKMAPLGDQVTRGKGKADIIQRETFYLLSIGQVSRAVWPGGGGRGACTQVHGRVSNSRNNGSGQIGNKMIAGKVGSWLPGSWTPRNIAYIGSF